MPICLYVVDPGSRVYSLEVSRIRLNTSNRVKFSGKSGGLVMEADDPHILKDLHDGQSDPPVVKMFDGQFTEKRYFYNMGSFILLLPVSGQPSSKILVGQRFINPKK